jgi:signal transduction histidine kinase
VGTAGFASDIAFGGSTGFMRRLAECRERGAALRMLEAMDTRQPVVVLHRKPALLADPAWAPMHELLGGPVWDSFASVPLLVRDRCVGAMNAFFAPGADPDADALAFLSAIADQAAMAVDYTALLARSAVDARRAERKRITRDLHDSVVQQVFSLRMRASALVVELERDAELDREQMLAVVRSLAELSTNALGELRELLFELRPESLRNGLLDAARAHAARIAQLNGLTIVVDAAAELPELPPDLEHDLYRILQEALHNAVKHSGAGTVAVRFLRHRNDLVLEIQDDGRGCPDHRGDGTAFGLVSMSERAAQWGGRLEVETPAEGGCLIRVAITP